MTASKSAARPPTKENRKGPERMYPKCTSTRSPTRGRMRPMHEELSPVEKVLDRLEDYKVRKDEYRARCPAHNGNSDDSLSIKEGDDGRALLICHAHCEIEDILEALDLDMIDLFVKGNGHSSPGAAKKSKRAAGPGDEKHKILTTDELP